MNSFENFEKPFDVHQLDEATSVYQLMPKYAEIPEKFKDPNNPTMWNKFQSDWFFAGLGGTEGLVAREGIDKAKALKHLKEIQRSYELKDEEREAGVAYLASTWFDESSTWKITLKG